MLTATEISQIKQEFARRQALTKQRLLLIDEKKEKQMTRRLTGERAAKRTSAKKQASLDKALDLLSNLRKEGKL